MATSEIKAFIDYVDGIHYYQMFTVVDENVADLKKADVFNGKTVTDIREIRIDCEQEGDAAWKYDYYEVDTFDDSERYYIAQMSVEYALDEYMDLGIYNDIVEDESYTGTKSGGNLEIIEEYLKENPEFKEKLREYISNQGFYDRVIAELNEGKCSLYYYSEDQQ